MHLKRIFYLCLICASVLMLGLNSSGVPFSDTKLENQPTHRQAGDRDGAPEAIARYYVARSGDNSNGSSWEKAYQNVQAALILAAVNGVGEIWVAKGVYYPDEAFFPNDSRDATFVLQNNIKLYGGFDVEDSAKPTLN